VSDIQEPIEFLVKSSPNGVIVTGNTYKIATCEKCRARYAYPIARSAGGLSPTAIGAHTGGLIGVFVVLVVSAMTDAFAKPSEREVAKLRTRVAGALHKGFDLVPCPKCGWYEQRMATEARHRRLKWMTFAGLLSIIVSLSLLLIVAVNAHSSHSHLDQTFLNCIIGAAGGGFALLALRWVLNRGYDVNVRPPGAPPVRFHRAPEGRLIA
jgi:hypothetical protein